MISAYPDYNKAPPEYLLAVTELLSSYDDETVARLVDLRTGIPARCKFLPSIADIVEMAEEPQRIREQFLSPPTAYKKLPPAPDYDESPEEMERRRGFIERLRRETSFMRFTG